MRSLTWKIGLAFVLVSLTGTIVAAVFVWRTTQKGFQDVARAQAQSNFVSQMANYYQFNGSWDGVAAATFHQEGPNPNQQPPDQHFILVDQSGMVIVPGRTYHLGQVVPGDQRAKGVSVKVDGQMVGTVLSDGDPPLNPAESQFLASTEQALFIGALVAFLIAVALGIILARSLTRPVHEIITALRAMTGGELQQAVPVRSRDELGELSAAFNQMSGDLAFANQQRRQMTADIAHDLRTPVTVIAGYLEALRDGVLPPTPERFAILYEEAQHLQSLIEDLRTLSLADTGELSLHRQPIDPQALAQRIGELYRHQAEQQGVNLRVAASDSLPSVVVDEERMMQVLRNLVSNALRYTPEGGTITIGAEHESLSTVLSVSDTGQGIKPEALPRIFDRFFRADAARVQAQGESGLGLAIAKALVEAHGGTIGVASMPGQGAAFRIVLPDETTPMKTLTRV